MTALRWTLGIIITVLAGGFVMLSVVAGGFRKSFGASDTNPLVTMLPLLAAAVLLAGLIVPSHKPLLHAGAVAAVGLISFCVWQMIAESATVTWLGIAYLIAWLVFYYRAAWQAT
ncbi:MAG: hypothetical protein ABJB66_11315 [Gemmatimonadaceae bacterium]